jgi:hypothetical protein
MIEKRPGICFAHFEPTTPQPQRTNGCDNESPRRWRRGGDGSGGRKRWRIAVRRASGFDARGSLRRGGGGSNGGAAARPGGRLQRRAPAATTAQGCRTAAEMAATASSTPVLRQVRRRGELGALDGRDLLAPDTGGSGQRAGGRGGQGDGHAHVHAPGRRCRDRARGPGKQEGGDAAARGGGGRDGRGVATTGSGGRGGRRGGRVNGVAPA